MTTRHRRTDRELAEEKLGVARRKYDAARGRVSKLRAALDQAVDETLAAGSRVNYLRQDPALPDQARGPEAAWTADETHDATAADDDTTTGDDEQ